MSGHIDNTQIPAIGQGALPEQARAARKLFRQGQDGYASAHDTHVRSDLPTNAYGATATLVVDQDDNGAAGSQPVQSVVRFDDLFAAARGGIPAGSTIRSAKLTLHTGDASAATAAPPRSRPTGCSSPSPRRRPGTPPATSPTTASASTTPARPTTITSPPPSRTFPSPDTNSLASFDVTATLAGVAGRPGLGRGWVILSNSTDGWRWDSTEAANAALRPSLEIAYVPDFALGVAWSFSGDGNWSQDAKWSVGLAPDSPDAVVHFPATGGVGHTVTLTAPAALRAIVFDSPKAYAITGAGALSFGANAAIDVPAGTHTIAAPIALSDALTVTVAAGASLGVSGDLAANGHAITKAGAGTLELKNARAGALAVNAGMVTIIPNGSAAATSRVASLSIASGATLDLKDNKLIVPRPPRPGRGTASAYTGVTGLVDRPRQRRQRAVGRRRHRHHRHPR